MLHVASFSGEREKPIVLWLHFAWNLVHLSKKELVQIHSDLIIWVITCICPHPYLSIFLWLLQGPLYIYAFIEEMSDFPICHII